MQVRLYFKDTTPILQTLIHTHVNKSLQADFSSSSFSDFNFNQYLIASDLSVQEYKKPLSWFILCS